MNARTEIAVSVRCPAWTVALPEAGALVHKAGKAALARVLRESASPRRSVELSLVLADDALVRRLNRRYRDKDKPTNVLSFPASTPAALDGRAAGRQGAPPPLLLGDVIIAFETTRREAAIQGMPLGHHLAHLVIHGTLHLLGYDHEEADEAQRMERLEVDILRRLGIPDPYRSEDDAPCTSAHQGSRR